MPPRAANGTVPAWDKLFVDAQACGGYFTTQEAALRHVGSALLTHHVRSGRLKHAADGVLRFTQFPTTEHEDLIPLWLWSARKGFFSHETALALHGLLGRDPKRVQLTLPTEWAERRLTRRPGVDLHFAQVAEEERGASGPVAMTALVRTLNDCVASKLDDTLLQRAVRDAYGRGALASGDEPRLAAHLQRWAPKIKGDRVR